MTTDPIITEIAALLIAGLMLLGGSHKAGNPGAFRATLGNYGVPGPLLAPVQIGLTAAELGIGGALVAVWLVPGMVPLGPPMLAAASLLGGYTLVLCLALARGLKVDCGCNFGGNNAPIGPWHIARNGVLLTIIAAALLPVGSRILTPLDHFTAVATTLALALFLVSVEALIDNRAYERPLEGNR